MAEDPDPDSISIYFKPLGHALGKPYYHQTIVYTDALNRQFYLNAGPERNADPSTSTVVSAEMDARARQSSAWGRLAVQTGLIGSGDREDLPEGKTMDHGGNPYVHVTVGRGPEMARAFDAMVEVEEALARLDIPYAPVTQNSNSMAHTALAAVGLPLPPLIGRREANWSPGAATMLPYQEALRLVDAEGRSQVHGGGRITELMAAGQGGHIAEPASAGGAAGAPAEAGTGGGDGIGNLMGRVWAALTPQRTGEEGPGLARRLDAFTERLRAEADIGRPAKEPETKARPSTSPSPGP